MRPIPPRYRPIACICAATAHASSVSYLDMMSSQRRFAHTRQMAMWLARDLTPASLPSIGHVIGGRDHTTVIHGCRAVERRAREDPDYADELARLREICKRVLEG